MGEKAEDVKKQFSSAILPGKKVEVISCWRQI
jgi:hypothetical protein